MPGISAVDAVRSLVRACLASLIVLGAGPTGAGVHNETAVGSHPEAEDAASDVGARILEFERHYDLAVGDKGEDRFDLPEVSPSCDHPGLAFESVEIVYLRRRFGEAQVVATPEPGCVRCGPIIVRRYHEPTGELHYRLRVHRRTTTAWRCRGAGRARWKAGE
jgi:hypothetical protein